MSIADARIAGLFDLTGRTVVVTGGTRGIGNAIARVAYQQGALVLITGRRLPAVEQACQEMDPHGQRVMGLTLDIADEGQVDAFPDAVARRAGARIDGLVLNAAVNPYFGKSSDMPSSAYQKVIDCNITSNLRMAYAFASRMADHGGGSIVVVSSIGGLRGSTHLGAYAISKAADMQLVRNLAVEWGPRNVRANCVAPGLIRTDFARALWENPEILRRRVHHTPLQRIGEPEEVAGCTIPLLADAGRYVTGQTIVVDGGVLAGSPWQTEGGE